MRPENWLYTVPLRLRSLFRRGKADQDLDEELRYHLDRRMEENVARGMSREEARYAALRRMGGMEQRKEECREARKVNFIQDFLQDFHYSLRVLRKNPGFSVVAILTLALGIGANTALFSVINAVVLRPLPVQNPQQLVVLSDPSSDGIYAGLQDGERSYFTYHEFEGLRENHDVFSGIFAFSSSSFSTPVATAESEIGSPAEVTMVSGSYFPVLGVAPELGRTFSEEVDSAHGAYPQAVLSHAFWQRRMQQDPNAIGRKIRIGQTVYDVIGVMPAEFTGIVVGAAPDLWIPVSMQKALIPGQEWLTQSPTTIRRYMFLHVVARLKPGVTIEQANAAMNITFHNILDADGRTVADPARRRELTDAHLTVRDARHGLSPLRGEYKRPLTILMGLVGLLLLLACANVANLLLARASGRQRELAVRVALGSSRARLVRQLLTESLVISVVGAGAGLLLAQWGDRLLLQLVSGGPTPVPLDVRLDTVVLAFALGVTLLTGLLFGLIPAVRATRPDLNFVLRGASRNLSGGGSGTGRMPIGKVLVGIQVAISLLLLVTAGLFVRSLQKLTSVPLGYEPEHLALFRINPAMDGYKAADVPPLYDQLLSRFSSLPGVRGVSLSQNGLFYGHDTGDEISIVGEAPKPGQEMGVALDEVGPNYFATIGIPVLLGRDVQRGDSAGTHHMWLNQAMSKYFFGEKSPLGRHIVVHFTFGEIEYNVVGVVADAKYDSLRDETPRRGYFSYFDPPIPVTAAVFEVRSTGEDAAVTAALRNIIHDTDAGLSVPPFRTIPSLLDARLQRDRLTARLSTFFGIVALLLASIGLYGVVSYTVARRTSEIGLRMALGAPRGEIVRMVLREALLVTLIGAAVGTGAALATTHLLADLIFGLTPRDPLTLAGSAVILLAVASFAAALPAWRASRVDPMVTLRYE